MTPQVVVLAGGLASRMLPRTADLPKILLPVAGRPFVDRLLERLATAGFAECVLCVGHLGELVAGHVGAVVHGMRVVVSDERSLGRGLLGTLGALRGSLERLEATFLVTYGDSWLPFDYLAPLRALDQAPSAAGVLAVFDDDDRNEASNCIVRDGRVVEYRKRKPGDPRPPEMRFTDYGAMALRRSALEDVPLAPAALSDLQARLAADGRLGAFVATERFYEIGSERGLAELEARLARGGT